MSTAVGRFDFFFVWCPHCSDFVCGWPGGGGRGRSCVYCICLRSDSSPDTTWTLVYNLSSVQPSIIFLQLFGVCVAIHSCINSFFLVEVQLAGSTHSREALMDQPCADLKFSVQGLLKAINSNQPTPPHYLPWLESKIWPAPTEADVVFMGHMFTDGSLLQSDRLTALLPTLCTWITRHPKFSWEALQKRVALCPRWWVHLLMVGTRQQKNAFLKLPTSLHALTWSAKPRNSQTWLAEFCHQSKSNVQLLNHLSTYSPPDKSIYQVPLSCWWSNLSTTMLRGLLDRGAVPPLLWAIVSYVDARGNKVANRFAHLTEQLCMAGENEEKLEACTDLVLAPLVLFDENWLPMPLVNLVTDFMVGEEPMAPHRHTRLQVALTFRAYQVFPSPDEGWAGMEQCWACRQPNYHSHRCTACKIPAYCDEVCARRNWEREGWRCDQAHSEFCGHWQVNVHKMPSPNKWYTTWGLVEFHK